MKVIRYHPSIKDLLCFRLFCDGNGCKAENDLVRPEDIVKIGWEEKGNKVYCPKHKESVNGN